MSRKPIAKTAIWSNEIDETRLSARFTSLLFDLTVNTIVSKIYDRSYVIYIWPLLLQILTCDKLYMLRSVEVIIIVKTSCVSRPAAR